MTRRLASRLMTFTYLALTAVALPALADRDSPGRPTNARKPVPRTSAVESPEQARTLGPETTSADPIVLGLAYDEKEGRQRLNPRSKDIVQPRMDIEVPPRDSTGAIPLSLERAIDLALIHNLDIHGARIDYRTSDARIAGARGAFDPIFNAFYERNKDVTPSGSALAAQVGEDETDVYQTSISGRFNYGASYEFGVTGVKSETNNPFSNLSPAFSTDVLLRYTQPLLRGLGGDSNKNLIRQAINTARIGTTLIETTARDIVRDTIVAYWELVFSIEDAEVRRASLSLAQELLRKNRIMVDVGTLAPLEIAQAEASVAEREFGIITADARIGDAADDLRRLIGVREGSPWWDARIIPIDDPAFTAMGATESEAIAIALARRSELAAAIFGIDNARIGVAAAKDSLRPQLDLRLDTTSRGLDGDQFTDDDPLVDSDGDGDPTNDQDTFFNGGFSDSFSQVGNREFNSWSAALIYRQPLRNRAAKSDYLVQRLTMEDRELDLEKLRQTITLEVRAALRALDSGRERITSAGAARTLQQKTLQAEIKKFENGLSTNFEVLQFQTDLQSAESAELRALTDYLQAQAELKRARGTLLEDYGLAPPPR